MVEGFSFICSVMAASIGEWLIVLMVNRKLLVLVHHIYQRLNSLFDMIDSGFCFLDGK